MLNGLDIFSGIGGLTAALSPWVRPVAYCEIEKYAQGVLLSRMSDGRLPIAPIWDNIRTLKGTMLPKVDIIYGGFPCQDISVAGRGKGLDGERSGLYFEVSRLINEINPRFIFLENVPAIRSRGLSTVLKDLADKGYDMRWTDLSAAEVGANHNRNRWWLLGYAKHDGSFAFKKQGSFNSSIFDNEERPDEASESAGTSASRMLASESFSNAECHRRWSDAARYKVSAESEIVQQSNEETCTDNAPKICRDVSAFSQDIIYDKEWWDAEPSVDRVVDELSYRVDRIKCLGNAVLPMQGREAFKKLIGL